MTHVTLHLAAGMAAGMAAMSPAVARAWQRRERLAPSLGCGLAASLALGMLATVPSLLRHAGAPDAFCDGWWMNLFVLYPAIRALLPRGGMPLGALALAGIFAVQYGLLLLAIRRAQAGRRTAAPSAPSRRAG